MHLRHANVVIYCDLILIMIRLHFCSLFFFFNDTATTEIYTLSLHDALPIYLFHGLVQGVESVEELFLSAFLLSQELDVVHQRSEEHTSELQSQSNLVCRLLLEKKKKKLSPTIDSHVSALTDLPFFAP